MVNRLANHHPGFRAALDERRAVIATEQANRALRIREKAPSAVDRHLDDGVTLSDALAVLRIVPVPTFAHHSIPSAAERLEADVSRMTAKVRPEPKKRGVDGRIPPRSQLARPLMYDVGAQGAERAERVATDPPLVCSPTSRLPEEPAAASEA